MSYLPHTEVDVRTMLARIGVDGIDALFDSIPASLRAKAELTLAPQLDERELFRHFHAQAARNRTVRQTASFLGGGAYHHYVPSTVDALSSRGEFLTAYTPYQAEISQGTLQAIFEFQTLVCQLTGLDIANASLYDGSSATAEAALMAMRVTQRKTLYVSAGLHPHYLRTLRTYTEGVGARIEILPLDHTGRTALPTAPPSDAAAVLVQSPSFFGCAEDLRSASDLAHAAGALAISITAEALSLALLRAPGELGVDIACGELQSFGLPLSFGGPYAGFLATRQDLLRQIPGRLIGETVDSEGRRAFVMTLTAREQHIRREKATSNICTNQGLCALRVSMYLALVGKQGLRKLAEINLSLAHYARAGLESAGVRRVYDAPFFNEFVVEVPDLGRRIAECRELGVQPGVALGAFDPERAEQLLVCATEMNTREEIDRLVRGLAS